MKRHTQISIGFLLLSSCGKELPPEVPDFRIETALNARADATFCFAKDENPFVTDLIDELIDEDINNNGSLDAGEDLNSNGLIDSVIDEDINNNNNLDAGEDINQNGVLDVLNDAGNLTAFSTKFPNSVDLINDEPCLRFTVFREDGSPALTDAASSSCAIRLDKSDLPGGDPLAFVLKNADDLSPIKNDQTLSMRIDIFDQQDGLIRSAFVSPFALQDAGNDGLIDQTITFFEDDRLSCVVPPSFVGGIEDAGQLVDTADITTLNDVRAFHSATTVGSPNTAGDGLGVVVAGGLTEIVANANADSLLTNTIEVFDRTSMRFVPSALTLPAPRAFHDAVALPKLNNTFQVAVVGGTTRSVGFEIEFFGGNDNKSPFPVLPLPGTAGTSTGYDEEAASGVEIISLGTDAKTVEDVFSVANAPGRFGAAVATIGEQLFYFGGIATTPGQNCAALPVTLLSGANQINNFFCSDYVEVTRAGTAVNDFGVQVRGPLATARIGAAAIPISATQVLLVGGNAAPGQQNNFAEIVDIVNGTSTALTPPANAAEARRAFFALIPLPAAQQPDPNVLTRFAMFGGDKLQDADQEGRIVQGANAGDPFGVKNFAAVLQLDLGGNTIAAFPATGVSIDLPIARPAGDLSPELLTSFHSPAGLRQDELLSEDRVVDPIADPVFNILCSDPNEDCLLTNLGERFVFPIAIPGPNNTILFTSGARGPLFPQDAILVFDTTDPTQPVLSQLENPNNPGTSLHLFRRALGLRSALLPNAVGANMLLLTGGLGGFATPSGVARFFENSLDARRDVSFFTFGTPADVIDDVCAFPDNDEVTSESEVCGFANTILKDTFIQRLFGRD